MPKFLKIILIKILFLSFCNTISLAEIIKNVRLKGNSKIQLETVLNKINFSYNKNYTNEDLNRFQKKLFDTGFFKEIKFNLSAETLTISVIENPVIDFFYIYGDQNKERIEKIYDLIELKSGNLYSDYKLQQDILKIFQIYKYNGFYKAEILPTVKLVDKNRVNISIKINKNEKFNINKIYFLGEKFFKSSELLDVLSSSENSWWKFLSTSSLLNEERINYDKFLLKKYYLNEGYYDAQIVSTKIDILENNTANLTFSINAGQKYYFGEINYNTIVGFENNDDFKKIFLNKTFSKNYSSQKVFLMKDKINNFLKFYRLQNYDFTVREVKDKNKININISFNERKLPVVNNILIKGNSITEEKVIRNNLVFSEGDSFSNYKLDKSKDNILATGIFKNVEISKNFLTNNLVDIDITIDEQPTGSIMGGVGIGSNETAINFMITEKNLFGQNIAVSSDLSVGTEKILGNFSISNPDFKDSGILVKNNFFVLNTDYTSVGYESSMFGNDLSTRFSVYEDLDFHFGVGFDHDKIDVSSSATDVYKSQQGSYTTFKTFYGLTEDKRNRKFNTTDGHILGFNQTVGIPGSDIPYLANNLYGKFYYSVSKDYILNVKSGVSSINSLNDKNVKLSSREFLGTRQLRGFEPRKVGPVDGTDHVGGNYSIYFGTSTTFPNPIPEKWNAKTILFLDAGNIWGVDYDSSKDSSKLRSAYGVGLDWISPLGPISFSLSNTISKADADKDQKFSFQIGSVF